MSPMLYLLLQTMVKALTGLLALFALVAAGALFLRKARASALARLKKGVLLALLICAVVATDWAQKGASRTPARSPRSAEPTTLVAGEVSSVEAQNLFPAYTNAVTNLCFTGIHPGETSVFLRVAWPLGAYSSNTSVELFGTPTLAPASWRLLGTSLLLPRRTDMVFSVPRSEEDWAESGFFRVERYLDSDGDSISDARERLETHTRPDRYDTDGDGLSDHEEVTGAWYPTLGRMVYSDPLSVDSDGDGAWDGAEAWAGTDPQLADTDGDGLSDGDELGVIEVRTGDGFRWYDTSEGENLLEGLDGVVDWGVWSRDLAYPVTVGGRRYFRMSVDVNGVLYLIPPNEEDVSSGGPVRGDLQYRRDIGFTNVMVAAYWEDLHALPSLGSSIRVCAVPSNRCTVVEWRRLAYTDRGEGTNDWATFQVVLPSGTNDFFEMNYLEATPGFLAHTHPSVGVQNPFARDFSFPECPRHLQMCAFPENLVMPPQSVALRLGTGTDPLRAGAADGGGGGMDMDGVDTDGDGLPDDVELLLGTDPLQPDTDDDGLSDGWEFAHSSPPAPTLPAFDPLVHNADDGDPRNDAGADPDGDGLDNAGECMWGTNPWNADTDGDYAADGEETGAVPRPGDGAQGVSDPIDPSDGGVPGSRVKAIFYFGDGSGSHSEKYRFELRCVAGDGASFVRSNQNYGECELQGVALKPGCAYELRLFHAGTAPWYQDSPCPDCDYTLEIRNRPTNLLVDDPQGLLGTYGDDNGGFTGYGKVVKLYVPSPPELTAPEVVGVNGDDDNGNGRPDHEDVRGGSWEDDLVEVKVRVAEPPGVQGTVTVTPYSMLNATLWRNRTKTMAVSASDVIAIPSSGIVERTYYLEGSLHSSSYRGEHLEVKIQCGSAVMTTNHAFTVVERIAEPITCSRVGGVIANPCCAVAGTAVPLKVDVLPNDFPDAEIRWRVVSGGGSFAGGGTGRTVQFTASGGEGALSTAQVDVGDCPGPAPQFTVRTTTPHEVLIFPCVIEREGEESPITASTLATWLDEVNAIYRQVGLHFSLGAPITNIVNDTWAQNGLVNTTIGAQIRNVLSNTGGIEVYFIPGNGGLTLTEPVGAHTSYGIILRNSANAYSLAHEIGHACGWADIYIRKNSNTPIPEGLHGRVKRDWMPNDWSGGGDVGGFYETDLRQYELIPRLLMYGERSNSKADIPAGAVYGLPKVGDLGNMNVGRYGVFTPSPRSL